MGGPAGAPSTDEGEEFSARANVPIQHLGQNEGGWVRPRTKFPQTWQVQSLMIMSESGMGCLQVAGDAVARRHWARRMSGSPSQTVGPQAGNYRDHSMSGSIQDVRARSLVRVRLTLINKPVHRSANGLHAHGVPESNEHKPEGSGRREVKQIQILKGKQLSRVSRERTALSPLMSIQRFVCAELAHCSPTGRLEICLFGTPHICRSGNSPRGND